jgi:hypothetical protein
MRQIVSTLFLLVVALISTLAVKATTLVSNLSSPVVLNPFMTECCWEAASFVNDGVSHSLTSVTVLAGGPVSSPTPIANLRANSGGLPGIVLVGLNVPVLPASVGQVVLTPQNPFTLAANTTYWVELGVADDKDAGTNARYIWATTDNSVVTGTGTIPTSYAAFNVGFAWFQGSVPNVAQSLQVDVDGLRGVPEPMTGLLIAGPLAIGFLRRRKKSAV